MYRYISFQNPPPSTRSTHSTLIPRYPKLVVFQGALEASKILAKIVASTETAGPMEATVLEMEEIGYTFGCGPLPVTVAH